MAAKEFGSTATDNTVVGQSILISGKLSGDEDLTVRGRVEGELNLTKTLIVEERASEIALRPKKDVKLSWEETAKAMAEAEEDWSDMDAATGDGLDDA